MEITQFAPVLIPTLNRHLHFKRCTESLSLCNNAEKTELFVFLDYPLKESHWEGYNLIRDFLPTIEGFKSVNVIERDKNYGAINNFFNAIEFVFERYDRLIYSEDDNVFAPSFLDFVNNGMEIYKNKKEVFAVSGYNNPYEMPEWYKEEVYMSMTFTFWGLGLFRDRWNNIDWSLENYKAMLSNPKNLKVLKMKYSRFLPQLYAIRDTGNIIADGFLLVNNIDKMLYGVVPVETRVRNTGHDGSGENCGESFLYMNQKMYNGTTKVTYPLNLKPNEKLLMYLNKKYIQPPFVKRTPLIRELLPYIPPKIKKAFRKMFSINR